MTLSAWLEANHYEEQFVVLADAAIWPGSHEGSSIRAKQAIDRARGIMVTNPEEYYDVLERDLETMPAEVILGRVVRFLRHDLREAMLGDDPAVPTFNIVEVDPPSVWDFPVRTNAEVRIVKDYLQDYLSLRGLALFEVYYATTTADADAECIAVLNGKDAEIVAFQDREFQLNYEMGSHRSIVTAQVWGARLMASPADMPITLDPIEKVGLHWPGYEGAITPNVAQRLRIDDFVYVDDSVLAPYEGAPDFTVYPESGAVSFGGQWSVGFSDRVGRNSIRLELKKLYEGAPAPAIRHWNRHTFSPDPAFLQAAPAERNIGQRAKEVVQLWSSIGVNLGRLADAAGEPGLSGKDFVRLDKGDLDYYGWWSATAVEPIARHVPLTLGRDGFLQRCLSLNNLLVESIGRAALRSLLVKLGTAAEDVKPLGGLKLLDLLVRLAQVSVTHGYSMVTDAKLIQADLAANGTEPDRPLEYLFGLYDLRIVGAHTSGDPAREIANRVERFGVEPGEFANGYGRVLDRIYDALIEELRAIDQVLGAVI
jgi:hypothetical protein